MALEPTILVVDDEEKIRKLFTLNLRKDYRVLASGNVPEAIEHLQGESVDVVLADLKLPGEDGIALLQRIKTFDSSIPVILITAYGTVQNAVEAMKLGAFDYLLKPVKMEEMVLTVQKAFSYRALLTENRHLRRELEGLYGLKNIVCVHPKMREILKLVEQIADSRATVLIQGETGTGKELIARAIHLASGRASKPFVPINCSAIPEGLLESELFGHEKGAFTSAVVKKEGKLERAHGGSLFLDEISEMSPVLQPKLLRVLEEQCFTRVGGVVPIEVDVRMIVATHRDLKIEVASERFREDLYYRLNVIPVFIPPLRERREDIAPLVGAFLKKHAGDISGTITGIASEALSALEEYHWPGNVRELENAILRAMVLARDGRIEIGHLPDEVKGTPPLPLKNREGLQRAKREAKKNMAQQLEKRFVVEALRRSEGNISQAARETQMDRRQFQAMMKRCGVRMKDLGDSSNVIPSRDPF